jgi:hypothetical protein
MRAVRLDDEKVLCKSNSALDDVRLEHVCHLRFFVPWEKVSKVCLLRSAAVCVRSASEIRDEGEAKAVDLHVAGLNQTPLFALWA